MLIEYITKVIGWMLFSSIKFLFAPSAMIGTGYNFLETVLYTSMGAALGVFIFYNGGEVIFNWFDRFNPIKRKEKRTFSTMRRFMIRMKNRYGLGGLLLISGLISVPVTALLAAKYYRNSVTTMAQLIMGFFIWSLVLSGASWLFKIAVTA